MNLEYNECRPSTKLLISCCLVNGGLFFIDLRNGILKKLYNGDCRGFVMHNDNIILLTKNDGIVVFNDRFELVKRTEPIPQDLHAAIIYQDQLLVVESGHNTIGIYDVFTLRKSAELVFNDSTNDEHHINDIDIDNGVLYMSMFSVTGGYKNKQKAELDGSIVALPIADMDLHGGGLILDFAQHVVHNNLKMPHSVRILENALCFCDSYNFTFTYDNDKKVQLLGYTRGIAYDQSCFFIGQSKMRRLARDIVRATPTSMDCGVYIYSVAEQLCEFIPIPAEEIYQIEPIGSVVQSDTPSEYIFDNEGANIFLVRGEWHGPEYYRWTSAVLAGVKVHKNKGENTVMFDLLNCYPGHYAVDIHMNGDFIGRSSFQTPGSRRQRLDVSPEVCGLVHLTLKVDQLWSPAVALGTADNRNLGIGLHSIQFGVK
jgi:hypothetical protein